MGRAAYPEILREENPDVASPYVAPSAIKQQDRGEIPVEISKEGTRDSRMEYTL